MSASKRGVGVYIFNEDGTKVLLTQRGPGARHEQYKWEGPGGAVDLGESFEAAAHREIAEELGITVDLGPEIALFEHTIDANNEDWQTKIFRATTLEVPRIVEPNKCIGFGWFDCTDIKGLQLASYVVKDFEFMGWL